MQQGTYKRLINLLNLKKKYFRNTIFKINNFLKPIN